MEGSRAQLATSRCVWELGIINGHNSSSCGYVINSFTNASIGNSLADVESGIATHAKVRPAVVDYQFTAEETHKSKSIGLDFLSTSAPPKAMPPMPPTPTETNLIMRSLITTLFVSDGIPLINAGDEYGHSLRERDCDLNPGRMKKMAFVGMLWKKVRRGMQFLFHSSFECIPKASGRFVQLRWRKCVLDCSGHSLQNGMIRVHRMCLCVVVRRPHGRIKALGAEMLHPYRHKMLSQFSTAPGISKVLMLVSHRQDLPGCELWIHPSYFPQTAHSIMSFLRGQEVRTWYPRMLWWCWSSPRLLRAM